MWEREEACQIFGPMLPMEQWRPFMKPGHTGSPLPPLKTFFLFTTSIYNELVKTGGQI